ncbi:MAG: RloB family protein [Bacilli bacterium]|nr:RloB family protein [Bacilli bacterium]
MAIRERVSLSSRYKKPIVGTVRPFRTYYLIMEGTKTEPTYFRLLEAELIKRRVRNNISLVYLERTENDRGSNSPQQLYDFLQKYRKDKGDVNGEYLMIFDRDSYKNHFNPCRSYLNFLNKVKKSKVRLLVTSPCFEIWLLLHQPNAYQNHIEPHQKLLFENARLSPAYTYISKIVRNVFGFNPKSFIPEDFLEKLDIAMKQSSLITSDLKKMATELGENISDFIKEISRDLRY